MRSEPPAHLINKLWVDVATTPWQLARAPQGDHHALRLEDRGGPKRALEGDRSFFQVQRLVVLAIQDGFATGFHSRRPAGTTAPEHATGAAWRCQGSTSSSATGTGTRWADGPWSRSCSTLGRAKHGVGLPEKLAELVPAELDRLPDDPYKANNAFGYVRSDGQELLPLGELEPVRPGTTSAKLRHTENCRLLYSVGPNLEDDRASSNDSSVYNKGDIIFPLKEGG